MGRSLHYAVVYQRTADGWVAMAPAVPAAAGQGANIDEAGDDLRQAIEAALAEAEEAECSELLEDHDERGPIVQVEAGVLEVRLEDARAEVLG